MAENKFNGKNLREGEYLVLENFSKLIREMSTNGENPATSGNFSYRSQSGQIYLSESGIDKVLFSHENFIPVDEKGGSKLFNRKASDEALIHLWIFEKFNPQVILHSHLLDAILFSDFFPDKKSFNGLELLKAFPGVKTHELDCSFLVVENKQEIPKLVAELNLENSKRALELPLILVRKHGFYTWGKNLFELRKHREAINYIFKYYLQSAMFTKY